MTALLVGYDRCSADQRDLTARRDALRADTQSYRLLKHGGFNRVLFLVDRDNLADQSAPVTTPGQTGLSR